MEEENFSTEFEPALGCDVFEKDASEEKVPVDLGGQEEIDNVRDSVLNEPAFTGKNKQAYLGQWLAQKRSQCSLSGNLLVTLLAALLGGPFAIIGAFMSGGQGVVQVVYVILVGPITEELLKQSGFIYILERKPYRVFSRWQFVFGAIISALIFATIENILYIYFYVKPEMMVDMAFFTTWRWTVCTLLHVGCSVIASFGLMRVWKKQLEDGRAADLSYAFSMFAAAIFIHGLYNMGAFFLEPFFMRT